MGVVIKLLTYTNTDRKDKTKNMISTRSALTLSALATLIFGQAGKYSFKFILDRPYLKVLKNQNLFNPIFKITEHIFTSAAINLQSPVQCTANKTVVHLNTFY